MPPASLFLLAVQGEVDELLRELPVDCEPWQARNANGESLILFCLYRGLEACLERLLARTATLPLHEAAAVGRADAVAACLKAAPWCVNALSPDGWTALHLAAFIGRNNDVIGLLLAHGAEPHLQSRAFLSNLPLHAACAGGNVEAALQLAEVTSNLDWQADENEHTALMIAAANGLEPIVRRLLALGADPKRGTADGKTPASLARENGHAAIAALLENGAAT